MKFTHLLINSFRKIMASSHKHHLKSLMLQIAKGLLDAEAIENCAALDMPGSLAELQEVCKTIHHQIDKVDEERYDLADKGGKCDKEVQKPKLICQMKSYCSHLRLIMFVDFLSC
uniref:Uncharacterized protein n=1 Tax=Oncorhynchus mykiss TaxID=8022 RepID=A0A8K9XCU2_ONCMY